MIIHAKRLTFKFAITVLLAWNVIFSLHVVLADGPFGVVRVLDGDTIQISDGRTVRLLGVDTPEKGEPWAEEARLWLVEQSLEREVILKECAERDKYGRTLALLDSSGRKLNLELAGAGLGVPMLIPPCGNMVADKVLEASASALEQRRGIYGSGLYDPVPHYRAGEIQKKKGVVFGKVLNIHKGKKAVHLNFGSDWKTDFTAVLFARGQSRYRSLGLDPGDLVGRNVYVLGKVEQYYGPQIVVNSPEQMLPWPEVPQ
jgi:endonuclease YncB( thermonuclease family)